jgi:uncharacterized protein YcaQ
MREEIEMTDKTDAEFEAWWQQQPHREQFEDVKDQMRNVWWASRAEMVIELPEPPMPPMPEDDDDAEEFEAMEAILGAQFRMLGKCRRAIEAAGAKWRE